MSSDPRCPAGGRPEAAGWVLGGLEPDDALLFGEHLLTCGECQAAVQDLQGAGSILLATSATADPPADLGPRTLARVQRAARLGYPSRPRAPRPRPESPGHA